MAKVIYENALPGGGTIETLYSERDGINAFWLPGSFPADVRIDWEMKPVKCDGAVYVYFAVKDKNSFQLSFLKRRSEAEKSFHLCHLIKNPGQLQVGESPDPLPDTADGLPWYSLCIVKRGKDVSFYINEIFVMGYHDDGISHGEMLTGGGIGFSHTGDIKAEYRNMKVTWI